jgi:hypothetical protein
MCVPWVLCFQRNVRRVSTVQPTRPLLFSALAVRSALIRLLSRHVILEPIALKGQHLRLLALWEITVQIHLLSSSVRWVPSVLRDPSLNRRVQNCFIALIRPEKYSVLWGSIVQPNLPLPICALGAHSALIRLLPMRVILERTA